MTKLFITGGTGYLGSNIVKQAIEANYDVRALYRTQHPTDGLTNKVDWVQGDLSNPDTLIPLLNDCDTIIHTAGLVSIWQKNPQDFFETNVQGTKNILTAALKANINKIIYTSSFFALGPTPDKPVDETWWNDKDNLPTPYAQSKRESLNIAKSFRQQGLNIITLYPGVVYGPGKRTQGNHITQIVADYVRKQLPGIPGKGETKMTLSYVDDVAKGHLLALKKAPTNSEYILGGEDASFIELFSILEELTETPRPKLRIPFSALKSIALLEESRAKFSKTYTPKLTRDVVEIYKYHWRYSSQKAIKEIDYRRTPLKTGLIKVLESLGYWKEDSSTIL